MYQLNSDLYVKETEDLVMSAMKKEELQKQKMSLISIANSVKKMKFEMEREEKITLKKSEKQQELEYIEY